MQNYLSVSVPVQKHGRCFGLEVDHGEYIQVSVTDYVFFAYDHIIFALTV